MPKRPSGTPAILALEAAGVDYVIHEYEHDPNSDKGFGVEGSLKLGVEPERVFKTLMVNADGRLVVGIVPVSGRLDLKAIASAVGAKRADMAKPEDAEKATGYIVGGISPLGQKNRHTTIIDESAILFDTILVSGGKRGLDIEIDPTVLAELTDAHFAPISRQ